MAELMTDAHDNYVSQINLNQQAIWLKDSEARARVAQCCRWLGTTAWDPEDTTPHLVDGESFVPTADLLNRLGVADIENGDIVMQPVYQQDSGGYVKAGNDAYVCTGFELYLVDVIEGSTTFSGNMQPWVYTPHKLGGDVDTSTLNSLVTCAVADYMQAVACYTPTGSVNMSQVIPTGSVAACLSDAGAQIDTAITPVGTVNASFSNGVASVSGSIVAQGSVSGTQVSVNSTSSSFSNVGLCLSSADEILNVTTTPVAYVASIDGTSVIDPTFSGCATGVSLIGCASGSVTATFDGGVSTISLRAPVTGNVKGVLCGDPLCMSASFCGDACTIISCLQAKSV